MTKEINEKKEYSEDIFIYGKTGSGKDTLADYLKQYFGYNKMRLADTIKRIICEKNNISFDELEELKRTNPDFRNEHTITGDYLGKQSSLNRAQLLVNRKALDFQNVDKDTPIVICDVRDKEEAETLLNLGCMGIFLNRTTDEYQVAGNWTENNMFTNGEINDLILSHSASMIIVFNNDGVDSLGLDDIVIPEEHDLTIVTFNDETDAKTEKITKNIFIDKMDVVLSNIID